MENRDSTQLDNERCYPTFEIALMDMLSFFGFRKTAQELLKIPKRVGDWQLIDNTEYYIRWMDKGTHFNEYLIVEFQDAYGYWSVLRGYEGMAFDIFGDYETKECAVANAIRIMSTQ